MTPVFLNEKTNKFYCIVGDQIFSVYLPNIGPEVHLLTAKNGKKYLLAELRLRYSKKSEKNYFEAIIADKEI